jgi:diguanylate cyclase (GGDEF)-like protein/PAS domain S-box-containing protein
MLRTLPAHIFSFLVHDSLDAVLIIDSEGHIQYANPTFTSLVGYAEGEMLGKSLNGLLPEAVARMHDYYMQAYSISMRSSTVLGKVREMQLLHRSGEIIPIEMKAVDLGVLDGCHYLAAFMTDLRLRKKLEAQNNVLLSQLQRLALTDVLTELPNRRALDAEAKRIFALSIREEFDISIGVVDIDHFKKINDTYGHPAGDQVLQKVAALLQKELRAGDFIGRTGGEEFGLLFPSANLNDAISIAERLRMAVESARLEVDGQMISSTVSIGVAQAEKNEDFRQAMNRADKALYQAKNNGRNRVECLIAVTDFV